MMYLDAFIKTLSFDQLDLYSYNRGEIYQQFLIAQDLQIEKLHLRMDQAMEADKKQEVLRQLQAHKALKNRSLTSSILMPGEKLHPTAQTIGRFGQNDTAFKKVADLLKAPTLNPIAARCAPEFRDAIIFKKEGRVVEALSICFHCVTVHTTLAPMLYAGEQFYQNYEQFLLDLGHNAFTT